MFTKLKSVSPGIIIGGVILIVLASAGALLLTKAQPTTPLYLGSGVFDAKILYTQLEREKGYQGVETIPQNQALVLAFIREDMWKITMKDMKVPLDVVWLNTDKKVVYIAKNVAANTANTEQPTILIPTVAARYVIELPAGTVDEKAIRVGLMSLFDSDLGSIQE